MKKTPKAIETSTDFTNTWVIIKGQFIPSKGVKSYDPEDPNTHEWYQALDRNTFHTVSCGPNFNRVVRGLMDNVKCFKTQEAYYKFLGETTTEDYYRIHYLGMAPYSPREKETMAKEGLSCAVSTPMKDLYRQVVDTYGDYFYEEVEDAVSRAYRELYEDARKTNIGSVKHKVKLTTWKQQKSGADIVKSVPKTKKEREVRVVKEEHRNKVTLRKNTVKLSLGRKRV